MSAPLSHNELVLNRRLADLTALWRSGAWDAETTCRSTRSWSRPVASTPPNWVRPLRRWPSSTQSGGVKD